MIAGSAAPSLPSFLPFYFRVCAFSIQRGPTISEPGTSYQTRHVKTCLTITLSALQISAGKFYTNNFFCDKGDEKFPFSTPNEEIFTLRAVVSPGRTLR